MQNRLLFFKTNLDQGVIYSIKFKKGDEHYNVTFLKTIAGVYFWNEGRVACVGDWEYALKELDRYAGQKVKGNMFYAAYTKGIK